MNPVLLVQLERVGLYLGLMAALFFYGWHSGVNHEKEKAAAEMNKAVAVAAAEYKDISERYAKQSADLAAAQATTKTAYKTITNTIEREIHDRPIYTTTVCFDDVGLRLFNAGISGDRQTSDTDKSNAGMPTATAP